MSADQPVALVTGSTSGIGEAVVRRLAGDGYRVVVNSVTSVDAGAKLVAELGDDVARYVQGDIAVEADVQRLVAETINGFGRLDVLVNNAGTTQVIPHGDFESATPDVFRRLFDVNVIGTWQLTVAAMPQLREAHGCVVNVSSLAGVRPVGSSIPYAVSKAALNHLTRLLANVVGPEVRVNAVAPGLVDTPWTADWHDVRAVVHAMAPLQASAQPDDVVEVVLSQIRSRYVTGEVWVVDGGFQLR
ncbi:MAG TPA: SDR family oxidoreductase [Mycobacteriales bacterium]|jgi:ketoreductase RED2|nr:SDR family oxidoreductase [Mycobacteriales bacterium]